MNAWAHPTHHPEWHPDPISHFVTIHMCKPTDGPSKCSVTLAFHSIESDVLKIYNLAHVFSDYNLVIIFILLNVAGDQQQNIDQQITSSESTSSGMLYALF